MISQENFNLLCWIWIGIGAITFLLLLKVKQPYGRHAKNNWGPMINNRLGWLLMELPALLVFAWFLSFTPNWHNKLILVAAPLWGLHYIHRSIIFPFRLKTKGKKMPVVIMVLAIFFNFANGFFNGYWLANFAPAVGNELFTNTRLIIGTVIFISGFIINQYHDRLLIKLRNGSSSVYKIPFGGLFKYVSCPNFLGEIIIWLGFFIVTAGLPAFAFFVWTVVNLIPRAIDHHKWYKNEFADYPVNRKAVFPILL
jgi:hypothetical protein